MKQRTKHFVMVTGLVSNNIPMVAMHFTTGKAFDEAISQCNRQGASFGWNTVTCFGKTFEDVQKYDPWFEDFELVDLNTFIDMGKKVKECR